MPALTLTLLPVKTKLGNFVARYSPQGLAALDFPSSKRAGLANQPAVTPAIRRWHTLTTRAVKAVLEGKTPGELPPLDVSQATDFQRRVWEELTWTPCGETRSYAEVARAIRKPKASRAVGGACGANPIPLLIPCHRVLATGGKLGGFSGGLNWKRRLLAAEGHPGFHGSPLHAGVG
jgi:methylated-DNA-[protein]-cysteine S-methyltransferase